MVDAAEIIDARGTGAKAGGRVRAARAGIWCELRPFDQSARDAYAAFCRPLQHSAPQNPSFAGAWADEPDADMVVATLTRNGSTELMLALEVAREGSVTVARHPGGRHANGSFPAFTGKNIADVRGAIAKAIRETRADIDLLSLERNERERGGMLNPLLGAGCVQSPNFALAVDLNGGFDEVLERSSGKRKRKKHRSQTRKFETAGGYRRFAATSKDEVDSLLATFYEMKAERFRHLGIGDVFADSSVKNAFRRMFVEALDTTAPQFILHGLEVGGVVRAVTGSSISDNRMTCEFSAFSDDELSSASPGDFLFFENIREACENGLAIYDFGVGDELYKRLWCNIESRHFDLHVPLTAKGRIVSAGKRTTGAVKRAIKENQFIWSFVKQLRKSGAGKPVVAGDD
jgi:CelD/BcsL family acetyltransferase involved in cellulose biosynthesis